jgi:hypothetical protein
MPALKGWPSVGTVLQRLLAWHRRDTGIIIIKMHDERLGLARHCNHCISGNVAWPAALIARSTMV